MSSVGQAAAPGSGRQPARRPSVWRKIAAAYLDFLFSSFLGWITATAFGAREQWTFLAIAFLLTGVFLCRNFLKPTLGDLFMNIRYLSSSSNQVVADIRVVNPKLRLNPFLLLAGTLETTLAMIALSAWTVLDQAVSWGVLWKGPSSFLYYASCGFLLFLCGAALLCGSRNARWAAPITHAVLLGDLFLSAELWLQTLPGQEILLPWYDKPAPVTREALVAAAVIFAAWSVVLSVGLVFSRKHLVQ